MYDMQVVEFPELYQIVPVFFLIFLNSYPSVIVSIVGIIRKDQRIRLILKVNDPVGVVGNRIDQMPGNFSDASVL